MNTNSYCYYVSKLDDNNVHKHYHDNEYGFSIKDDNELFGRLILEINQAGLSWTTILNKKENFRKAYSNFRIETVANYTNDDITRLLNDTGIIRNKLKVNAVIYNAKQILSLKREYGSFKNWLDEQGKLELKSWVKLFKQNFKFTGGEITKEFLISTAYLPGAHDPCCPVFNSIKLLKQ